jgi:hypothetical protein
MDLGSGIRDGLNKIKVNGTFISGKRINPNQMIILNKDIQIVFAEMKEIIVVKGLGSN